MRSNIKNIVIIKGLKVLRVDKLRQKLIENSLDALIITSSSNIYYLSGFSGTNAVLFITLKHKILLTDFRYLEQAGKEAAGFDIIRADRDLMAAVFRQAEGITKIGIEEESISWAEYQQMAKLFAGCSLIEASHILREMRQVKDQEEIDILRQAIRITDEAFRLILDKIKPGVEEEEISLDLEYSLRKMGASGRSFDYIVASGSRSALPHGVASAKKIEKRELLTLDFGAKYQWYCSDFTRTVFVGRPEAKHREIYDLVLEAQLAAIDIIKPGLTGKEVDAVARNIISQAGYAEYFGHGLGHSVGLEIHETPSFNTREEMILEPGMVITVEPGVYLPGWGGVRIEDVVLVTNYGVEVLTQAPKQFIILD